MDLTKSSWHEQLMKFGSRLIPLLPQDNEQSDQTKRDQPFLCNCPHLSWMKSFRYQAARFEPQLQLLPVRQLGRALSSTQWRILFFWIVGPRVSSEKERIRSLACFHSELLLCPQSIKKGISCSCKDWQEPRLSNSKIDGTRHRTEGIRSTCWDSLPSFGRDHKLVCPNSS